MRAGTLVTKPAIRAGCGGGGTGRGRLEGPAGSQGAPDQCGIRSRLDVLRGGCRSRGRARHSSWAPTSPGGGTDVATGSGGELAAGEREGRGHRGTERLSRAVMRSARTWLTRTEPADLHTVSNPGGADTGALYSARTRRPPGRPRQSRSVIAAKEATPGRRRPLADGILHTYGLGCLRDPESRAVGGVNPSRKIVALDHRSVPMMLSLTLRSVPGRRSSRCAGAAPRP